MTDQRRPAGGDEVVVVASGRPTLLPPDLGDIEGLRLRIWNVGFRRFADLAALTNLVELTVLDWKDETFEPLRGLVGLERLTVIHFPKVSSLEPLTRLSNLEALTLETLPSWDVRKQQVVDSLAPLGGMTRLRMLRLGGVYARDENLAPLRGMHDLELLGLGNTYPQRALAELAAALPQVQSSFLAPYLPLAGHACKRCGGEKVMLSGSDVPNPRVVCPTCNRRKVEEFTARFEAWRAASRPAAGA